MAIRHYEPRAADNLYNLSPQTPFLKKEGGNIGEGFTLKVLPEGLAALSAGCSLSLDLSSCLVIPI
jgi:hypothetical protein